MRLPAFGARGSIRAAGFSRKVALAANSVAATVMPTERPAASKNRAGSIGVGLHGTT